MTSSIEASDKYTTKSKVSTLALRIARDAVFGEGAVQTTTTF